MSSATVSRAARVWEAALGRLQLQVPRPMFDTLLSGTTGVAIEDGSLVVGTPSPLAAEWLRERLLGQIRAAVVAVSRTPYEVTFRPPSSSRAVGASPDDDEPAVPPADVRYTFDSFVVGPSNHLAFAAASAIADNARSSYNPLVIYGTSGLGKTHLLRAITHRAQVAGRSPLCVTSEEFTNDYTSAIRERRVAEFNQRYRGADLLLVDDIQFLGGKSSTQETFFHIFNVLHERGCQIVVTADQDPTRLPLFDERLRSRLEWGLQVDITKPTEETRRGILARCAVRRGLDVPGDVLDVLARHPVRNVRQLEGAFNRIAAHAQLANAPLNAELVESVMERETRPSPPSTPEAIIDAVSKHYGLMPSELAGARRDRASSTARQVAMYLLADRLKLSPAAIGRLFGGRDRATVLYSVRKVSERLHTDSALQRAITTALDVA